MRSIVATTATGSWPIAVSALSITALAPSSTALATSVTSARVGTWECVIDSSICVATTTGRAKRMPSFTIRFCRCGTSSIGMRTPRSPRATMMASATSTMSKRLSTASDVSILAITITSSRPSVDRTASTSLAVRTKLTARISKDSSRSATSRSTSSLVGSDS